MLSTTMIVPGRKPGSSICSTYKSKISELKAPSIIIGAQIPPNRKALITESLLPQFVESGVRSQGNQLGQLGEVVFGEFCGCAASVWQRRNMMVLTLLAQEFVNEGFVDAKQFRNLSLASVLAFYGIYDALSKV